MMSTPASFAWYGAGIVGRPRFLCVRAVVVDECDGGRLQSHEALWRGRGRGFANARLEAFLADLAAISSEKRVPLVLALRDIPAGCVGESDVRRQFEDTAATRLTGSGLAFVDHDKAMQSHLAGRRRSELQGFGSRIGLGHLNAIGHSVYAGVTVDVILQHLLKP